jgi:hypothetical protein
MITKVEILSGHISTSNTFEKFDKSNYPKNFHFHNAAISNINGTTGYSVDGYALIEGSRIIFAADIDSQVRNKIYEVTFIIPDTVPPLIAQPVINLVPASDSTVLPDQTTVCLSGSTLQGQSFYFDGIYPTNYKRTSPTFKDLIDLFNWRNEQIGIKFLENGKMIIENKEVI